jgi:hypothetical protein
MGTRDAVGSDSDTCGLQNRPAVQKPPRLAQNLFIQKEKLQKTANTAVEGEMFHNTPAGVRVTTKNTTIYAAIQTSSTQNPTTILNSSPSPRS